jgi:hypothetical protein
VLVTTGILLSSEVLAIPGIASMQIPRDSTGNAIKVMILQKLSMVDINSLKRI